MINNPNLNENISDEVLFSEAQLKKLYGLSKRFWQARRQSGDGPPFIRLSGRCVRYKCIDVENWLNNRRVSSTSVEKVEE